MRGVAVLAGDAEAEGLDGRMSGKGGGGKRGERAYFADDEVVAACVDLGVHELELEPTRAPQPRKVKVR